MLLTSETVIEQQLQCSRFWHYVSGLQRRVSAAFRRHDSAYGVFLNAMTIASGSSVPFSKKRENKKGWGK